MKRFIATLSMVSASAVTFQLGGCGSALQYIGSYNPCLTIVACNPAAYEFARSGLDGFTFDPAIDPFCALPPFCSPTQDPIFGTVLGGG
jgi:hypothetical protein